MKTCAIIVFLAVLAFGYAIPAIPGKIKAATGSSNYFKAKLEQIQGAIDDSITAGMDLEVMEERLQDIVNLSSYFFRTESVTEYAVNKDAYANDWKAAGKKAMLESCSDNADCRSGYCYKASNQCFRGEKRDGETCSHWEECEAPMSCNNDNKCE